MKIQFRLTDLEHTHEVVRGLTKSENCAVIMAGATLSYMPKDQWDNEVDRILEGLLESEPKQGRTDMVNKLRPLALSMAPLVSDLARIARDLLPLNEEDRKSTLDNFCSQR